MELIDLTLDDDEVEQRTSKRSRTDEVVEVVEEPSENPGNAENDVDLGGEDLMIVRLSGEQWNLNFPHAREHCGKYPFAKSPELSNANFCSNCFCYICDTEASQCKEWGSGKERLDHCNAHSGSCTSRERRAQHPKSGTKKPLQQPNQRTAPPPAPARPAVAPTTQPLRPSYAAAVARPSSASSNPRPTSSSATSAHRPAVPSVYLPQSKVSNYPESMRLFEEQRAKEAAEKAAKRAEAQRAKEKKEAEKRAKSQFKDVPLSTDSLMKIATIKLPCRVKKYSINAVAKRISPHGWYHDKSAHEPMAMWREDGKSRLNLKDLFDVITLDPLPLNENNPINLTEEIRRPILVCRSDTPSEHPLLHGIDLPRQANYATVVERVRAAMNLPPSKAVILCNTTNSAPYLPCSIVKMSENFDDRFDWPLAAYVVDGPQPKDTGDGVGNSYSISNTYAAVRLQAMSNSSKLYDASLSQTLPHASKIPIAIFPLSFAQPVGSDDLDEDAFTKTCIETYEYLLKPVNDYEDVDDAVNAFVFDLDIQSICDHRYNHTLQHRFFNNRFSKQIHEMRLTTLGAGDMPHFDFEKRASMNQYTASMTAEMFAEHARLSLAARQKLERMELAKSLPMELIFEIYRHSGVMVRETTTANGNKVRSLWYGAVEYSARLLPNGSNNATSGNLIIDVFVPDPVVRHGVPRLDNPFFSSATSGKKGDICYRREDALQKHIMMYELWDNQQYWDMRDAAMEYEKGPRYKLMDKKIPDLISSLQDREYPTAEQPAGLTVELRPYQLQSLQFMLDRERLLIDGNGFRDDFWIKMKMSNQAVPSMTKEYYYSPVFGSVCEDVPSEMATGGILAEEMGLGKTVEVLSLVLSNPYNNNGNGNATNTNGGASTSTATAANTNATIQKTSYGLIKSKATLVICPVSLVAQWVKEAKRLTNGSLSIYAYYGSDRISNAASLATKYDVVVTTYGVLTRDYKSAEGTKKKKSALHQVKWHRLVLDESHSVKNIAAVQTKACIDLAADYRWCCTGTPMNNIEDLLGQLQVLSLFPFNNKQFFDATVKSRYNVSRGFHYDFPELYYLLRKVMIRHSKDKVLQLPPKTEELVPVVLTQKEQELYESVHKRCAGFFEQYAAHGGHFVAKRMLRIMSLLLPMRKICSGGMFYPGELHVEEPADLVGVDRRGVDNGENGGNGGDGDNANNNNNNNNNANNNNPAVREYEDDDDDYHEDVMTEKRRLALQPIICGSKVQALVDKLQEMRRANPRSKALIFSQFKHSMELIKKRLTKEGFAYRHISGDMDMNKRAQAIEAFQGDPPTTVFLMTLRIGAIGINLTAASHVFLLEPALNPALEDQAIGRAWRMGQKNEVKVLRFYVKGSVEEQLATVVKQRSTANNTATQSNQRGEGSGSTTAIGSITTDMHDFRLEEMKLLFKDPVFPPPRQPSIHEDRRNGVRGAAAGGTDHNNGDTTNNTNGEDVALPRFPVLQGEIDEHNDAIEGIMPVTSLQGASATGTGVAAKTRMRRSKQSIVVQNNNNNNENKVNGGGGSSNGTNAVDNNTNTATVQASNPAKRGAPDYDTTTTTSAPAAKRLAVDGSNNTHVNIDPTSHKLTPPLKTSLDIMKTVASSVATTNAALMPQPPPRGATTMTSSSALNEHIPVHTPNTGGESSGNDSGDGSDGSGVAIRRSSRDNSKHLYIKARQ